MYISKYLALCGVCSRRSAVQIVKSGQIIVNGKVVTDVTYMVLPKDKIKYKNKLIEPQNFKYVLLNKPKGYITTLSDEKGRNTVIDLIKDKSLGRIYPVGRLDKDTTGLLLLTNDGELAQKLSHPSFEISKKYHVVLERNFFIKDFVGLQKGLKLRDGIIKVDFVGYLKNKSKKNVAVQLHSGKNRIVRRIFEHLGYKVKSLDRFMYAGLTKKYLPVGNWKLLKREEIENLKEL